VPELQDDPYVWDQRRNQTPDPEDYGHSIVAYGATETGAWHVVRCQCGWPVVGRTETDAVRNHGMHRHGYRESRRPV
jgi:hypothetical protein